MVHNLPISEAGKHRIETSINNYRAFGRVEINIDKIDGVKVFVSIEQTHLINTKILSDKEMKSRVRDIFSGTDLLVHVRTHPIKGGSSPNYHEINL